MSNALAIAIARDVVRATPEATYLPPSVRWADVPSVMTAPTADVDRFISAMERTFV